VSLVREKLKERGYNDIPDPESLSQSIPENMETMLDVTNSILNASPEFQAAFGTSPELFRLFLPTGLAELRMIRDYERGDTVLFDVPITAIHGEMDDKVTASEMRAWQELTQGPFTFHTLPGGHLFLHEDQDQKQLLELIAHDLEKYA